MLSKFFIDRPILSMVMAIFIVLTGVACMLNLPIEQYPNITPPQINITASYPGADAQTVSDSVAAPLEQQINGVENMIYMYSTSASSGSYNLTVFFESSDRPIARRGPKARLNDKKANPEYSSIDRSVLSR
jgi:multidrug efflux pump